MFQRFETLWLKSTFCARKQACQSERERERERERARESSALHATEGSLEAGRAGAARAQAGTHTLMSVR